MTYIVANYHCVQFQEKLMKKTTNLKNLKLEKKTKKPSFGPKFDPI